MRKKERIKKMVWIVSLIAIGLLVRIVDLKADRNYWRNRVYDLEDADVIRVVNERARS